MAGNHASYLDPVVLGISCKRKMHFLTKQELFKVPFLGYILRSVGSIEVRRGKSEASVIKKSIDYLKKGEVIALFPQGSRKDTIDLKDHYRGVGLIALKAGVPVVPVMIQGTGKDKKGLIPKVTVTFKDPIVIENGAGKDDQAKLSEMTMQKIFEGIKE